VGSISKVDIDEARGMNKIKITGFLQEFFVDGPDPDITIITHPTRNSIPISSFESWDVRYSPPTLITNNFSDIDIADAIGAVPDPTNVVRNFGSYGVIGTSPDVINTDALSLFEVTSSISSIPTFYLDSLADPTQSYATDEKTNFGVGADIAVTPDAGTGITSIVCGADFDGDGACNAMDQLAGGVAYNAAGTTQIYELNTDSTEKKGICNCRSWIDFSSNA